MPGSRPQRRRCVAGARRPGVRGRRRAGSRSASPAIAAGGSSPPITGTPGCQLPLRICAGVMRSTRTGRHARQRAELERGGVAEVDDPALDEGAAVVDAHDDAAAVGRVAHARIARQRQRRVRGGHRVHVVDLAVGGAPAMELAPVPGGQARARPARRRRPAACSCGRTVRRACSGRQRGSAPAPAPRRACAAGRWAGRPRRRRSAARAWRSRPAPGTARPAPGAGAAGGGAASVVMALQG